MGSKLIETKKAEPKLIKTTVSLSNLL